MAEQRIVAHQNPDAEDAQYLVHPIGHSPLELLPDTAWIIIIDFLLTNYTRNDDNSIDYSKNPLNDIRALSKASKTMRYRVNNRTGVIKDSDYETLYRMFLSMNPELREMVEKYPDLNELKSAAMDDMTSIPNKELFNLILAEFLPKKKFLQNERVKQYEALAIMNKEDRLSEILDFKSLNEIPKIQSSILCAAIKYRRFRIIDFLIEERGFNLSNMSREEESPILCAVWEFFHPENFFGPEKFLSGMETTEQLKEMVQFLTERGADINGVDSDGLSALHIAVNVTQVKEETIEEVMKMLIEEGINVNFQDKTGKTPLHYFIPFRMLRLFGSRIARMLHLDHYRRIAEILLEGGADPNIMDNVGKRPLDIALDIKDTSIQELFEKYASQKRGTSQGRGTVDSDFDVVLPPNKRNRSGGKFTQGIY